MLIFNVVLTTHWGVESSILSFEVDVTVKCLSFVDLDMSNHNCINCANLHIKIMNDDLIYLIKCFHPMTSPSCSPSISKNFKQAKIVTFSSSKNLKSGIGCSRQRHFRVNFPTNQSSKTRKPFRFDRLK